MREGGARDKDKKRGRERERERHKGKQGGEKLRDLERESYLSLLLNMWPCCCRSVPVY